MLVSFKLPFEFDPGKLKNDLAQFSEEDWVPHFNQRYYEGDWSGIVLRGPTGSSGSLYPGGPNASTYEDTPSLGRCSYITEVLSTFQCPLKSVRILRLAPGSVVQEHRDPDLGFENGEVRIHIPIQTNPKLEFYLRNRRLSLQEGQCWYLHLAEPHRLYNGGDTHRIHLVIDLCVNEWLKTVVPFEQDDQPAPEWRQSAVDAPAAKRNLHAFRSHVLANQELQTQLRDVFDKELFTDEVMRLAYQEGFPTTAAEIENSIRNERILWHQRWIN